MSATVANVSRAAAMVVCAGVGCALAGPGGGAAGAGAGSVLGGLVGGLFSGAAGNFAHQVLDFFAGFFGESAVRPHENAPNHDLTAVAVAAIRDTLSAAAGQLGAYDPKHAAAKCMASATPEQIAATLASVPGDELGEGSIVAVVGTPLGGVTTPTKTPAFWTFIAEELAKKTDAHQKKSTGLKGAAAAIRDVIAGDLASPAKDPHADAAISFVAQYLHRYVANQVNDLLRGNSELGTRARHAAMFAYLRAILDAVQAPGAGVTMTDALRDAITDAVAAECKALAQEPKWFTSANQQYTQSVTTHATAIATQLTALGADTRAITGVLATIDGKLDSLSKQVADGFEMVRTRLDQMAKGTLSADKLRVKGNLAIAKVAPNRFFTGRVDELTRLHAALTGGSVAIVHALAGEGGIGKTELAKAYALLFAHEYDGVWWIDASKNAIAGEIAKVFRLATGQDAPPGAGVEVLGQAIAEHWGKEKHLVVLDNVDAPENFTLFGGAPATRVLATTREMEKTLVGVAPFRVDVLPMKDAVELMKKEIAGYRTNVSDADLALVAKELGGHALAVALAGAYLANYPDVPAVVSTRTTPSVLERLKAGGVGDVECVADEKDHDALGLAYRRSVAASLSLHFAKEDVKPALPVLLAASCLHPTGITVEWLAKGTGWTEDAVRKAVKTLAKHSILKYEGTISIHRLTQGVARARVPALGGTGVPPVIQSLLDALIDLFRWPDTMAEQLVDHTKTAARLAALPHAEAVLAHSEQFIHDAGEVAGAQLASTSPSPARTPTPATPDSGDNLGAKAARLHAGMARTLRDMGQLAAATAHIDASIRWGEFEVPRDERSLAIWYASRVSIRQDRGDLAGAEEDIQTAIDWEESQAQPNQRELAIRYASRARNRRLYGNLPGAEQDINTSIRWEESQPEPNQRELAVRYALRASIRQDRGDLAGAEADIAEAIAWGEAQSTHDRRSLAIWYALRASIRQDLGDLARAEEDVNEIIAWGEAQSPRDVRSLAIWYCSRASILQERGDLVRAEEDVNTSIAWGEAQSPPDARSLGIRYATRSRIRRGRGDLVGAEVDIQKSIDLGVVQTPRDERSLAIWYASRATIRQLRGDVAGAEEDLKISIAWGESQSPRDVRSLAILYASRARIRRDQALAARKADDTTKARSLFAQAMADIANSLSWWEKNLPSDERGLGILRKDHARIEQAAAEA